MLLGCLNLRAQSGVSSHIGEVEGGYNYILYTPADTTGPLPLIIALHSRSACGADLQSVDYFGTIDALESGMGIDAYVVAPQCVDPRWDAERVMRVAEHVAGKCRVDTNRISAIGMSMGGNGVADLAAAYPDRIAAAIILSGGATKGDVTGLSELPLWIIRGTDDREEAIRRTDEMVAAIRQQDSTRVIYSKVNGLDHRQHERILYMPYFYEWLISHNLQQPGRPISPGREVTAKQLKKAYNGLKLRDGSAAKRKSRHPRRPRL